MAAAVPPGSSPHAWRDVLADLARALHEAGAAAHRIEDSVDVAAAALGVEASVFATPTALILGFAPDDTRVMRVTPCEVDLARLARLDDLVDELCALPEEANPTGLADLRRRIGESPPVYGAWPTLAALALVPGAVAAAFGGGVGEVAVAAVVGFLAGWGERLLVDRPSLRRSWFLLASLGASLSAAATSAGAGLDADVIVLGGLIVLFPGFTLTTAVAELSTGNLAAGTSRLTAAALVLLQLGVGAAVASRLAPLLFTAPVSSGLAPASTGWQSAALLGAGLGLCLLLRVPRRWVPAALLASALSFWGTVWATSLLGQDLGALGGALLATAFSNAMARWFSVPAVVPLVPSIILLVPGSVGYRSMLALADQQTLLGVQTAVSMFFTAVAIVAGMLLAHTIVSPRRLPV